MVKDLEKVHDRVKYILEKHPETRDSDKLLWLAYNCRFNKLKASVNEGSYVHFRNWLMNRKTPMFESLSRARRKVQEQVPSLEGDKKFRLKSAKAVKEWSRNK